MAVTDEPTDALATAAAAAAAGAAIYGLRKALSSNGAQSTNRDGVHEENDDDTSDEGGVHSTLATVWDSASNTLLPIADQAVRAAGRWVAENSPEIVRTRIVPNFIDAFEDAA